MSENKTVPKRILSSILSSLSAGVVPRLGTPYIAIGRKDEIDAFLNDLNAVSDGASRTRFLVGRYGSGKSFLMQLIRGYALERGFLTADADLSPERRLYGSGCTGIATYRELIKNLASSSSPNGGALQVILAKWLDKVRFETGSVDAKDIFSSVRNTLASIESYVGGFDFSAVISSYFTASFSDCPEAEMQKSACLRWLRGEFASKTEAAGALGFRVSTVIDDSNWYNFIKLWSSLSLRIGYKGLIVFLDECVNLYKIVNRVSRENNYEMILTMFNDTLQGNAEGLELIFGGTPQFLEDTRRGLFSYEALRSRLCDSHFAVQGVRNLMSPVIRLKRLSNDELFALLIRVSDLHAQYYGYESLISEEEMISFYNKCLSRIGADEMITPREVIRDFLFILDLLYQNPDKRFADVISGMERTQNDNPNAAAEETERKDTAKYAANDIVF